MKKYKESIGVYNMVKLNAMGRPIILCGSMNDVRNYTKDMFNEVSDEVKHNMGFINEEAYYMYLDDDTQLISFLKDVLVIRLTKICNILIDDFEIDELSETNNY